MYPLCGRLDYKTLSRVLFRSLLAVFLLDLRDGHVSHCTLGHAATSSAAALQGALSSTGLGHDGWACCRDLVTWAAVV